MLIRSYFAIPSCFNIPSCFDILSYFNIPPCFDNPSCPNIPSCFDKTHSIFTLTASAEIPHSVLPLPPDIPDDWHNG